MQKAWRLIRDHFRRMALAYLVFVFTLVLTWAWGDYFARILEEGTKYLPIPVGGVGFALSFIMFGLIWMQVNARSKAERLTEDLRRSRERDRLVQLATHDMIRDWDLQSGQMEWNEAVYSVLGYSKKELRKDFAWWQEHLHPDEAKRVSTGLDTALKGGSETWSDEYRFRRINGTYASLIDRGFIVRDNQGRAQRMIASMTDISDRKRAEAALAEEKERLAVTLTSIAEGVITTDTAGNLVLINRVGEGLTGWIQEDAVGKPLADVFHVVDIANRERCRNPVDKVIQTGTVTGQGEDTVLVGRDGSEKLIEASGAPIRDASGRINGVVLVFRDVTKKHQEVEESLKASKLESLAILANGIAHDLGNIVTAIIGNLSLTQMYANPNDKAFQKLEEAQKAALRAKTLIHQLSTFAKGGALSKNTSLLTDVIRETVTAAVKGTQVRLELDLAENIWPVEIDGAQFSLVLNNLVNQAQQAMPDGGLLKVCAENHVIGQNAALALVAGRYVRVTLTDHGAGIRPEHVKKMFDPYFVNEDKRSGLNLATAYAIVKKHGGLLTVESTLGAGTRFFIFLPVSMAAPVNDPEENSTQGKGRILVVDDEESIRMIAGELLGELGYEIELAANGTEALERYRSAYNAGRCYDIVILDLAMSGGLQGKETMEHLREFHPAVKVIVSSGYAEDPAVVNYQEHGFAGAVIKPYRMEELATVIFQLIGHSQF